LLAREAFLSAFLSPVVVEGVGAGHVIVVGLGMLSSRCWIVQVGFFTKHTHTHQHGHHPNISAGAMCRTFGKRHGADAQKASNRICTPFPKIELPQ
jgi:hypothetical protein